MDLAQFLRPNDDNDDLFVHNSLEFEGFFFSLIEHGKSKELSELLENFNSIDADVGIVANTPLRAQKNIFVVVVAFASRAAVRGGLDYEISMNISDYYLQVMESLESYDSVFTLMFRMIKEYTSIVEQIQTLSSGSSLVARVFNYVAQNLYSRITVSEISTSLMVNKSYLSSHFKKVTGKSLANYINEQKINEAKFLLTSTSKNIIDISEILCFSSQSYFHTVFLKVTGMTPVVYRNLYKFL